MGEEILSRIPTQQQLKKFLPEQLPQVCGEIRQFMLDSVSKTGGHLASNLGVVELTVALHYALNLPQDKIVFDVGHQCYTHKILTGRAEQFSELRKLGGISGFPNPEESEYDSYIAGHGNTAISVAIGIARAKKLKKEPGCVVAIVGDGAFTGGMVYEGMNNIADLDNLIVVLNDNEMSISKNVGSIARYLTTLRTSPRYVHAKAKIEVVLEAIPLVGSPLVDLLQSIKSSVRHQVYDRSNFFEEMGFQYVGVVDGHDVVALAALIRNLRKGQYCPILLHVSTKKGKGYAPAEENPGEFHGVSAFDLNQLTNPEVSTDASFSACFGKKLVELATQNEKLCAITAAMKYGTGLQYFYHSYPERFFDVGMAEQHAITFAGGLSSQGMLPVVALYSTFLQRGYDQLIHDVRLMDLNVVLAIDRAGFVPGDGETHQGIFDPTFLSSMQIFTVSPCNYAELNYWLPELVNHREGPRAIRYSRGAEPEALAELECSGKPYDYYTREGAKVALVTYGTLTVEALSAQRTLEAEGIPVDVIKLVQITPLEESLCEALKPYSAIVFAEECVQVGSIGEHLLALLAQSGWQGTYRHLCVRNNKQPPATVPQLRALNGMDAAGMEKEIKEVVR